MCILVMLQLQGELGILEVGCRMKNPSHVMEAVHVYTKLVLPTDRAGHILRRPGGEAKGLVGWAIKQLAAFLNLSILLSTHCTHIVLDGSSLRPQYSIGSDCIVPDGFLGRN